MGGPSFIQNHMQPNQNQNLANKAAAEFSDLRFKLQAKGPYNSRPGETNMPEIKNLGAVQSNMMIPTNNLMTNLLNQKSKIIPEF